MTPTHTSRTLDCKGFVVSPGVIGQDWIARLIAALDPARPADPVRERNRRVYAMRNLLTLVPTVRNLALSGPIRDLVEPILGAPARVVRGLLFDKTPENNWKVAWHQDLSIAVRQRIEVPGFGPWSIKAGVTHVQPPRELLARILTLRLHLDDCGPENGPLLVIPGSHAHGILTPREVERLRRRTLPVACHVAGGGALLMRPLLLHASSSAREPCHRRVIHLEYSADQLPGGLQWCDDAIPHARKLDGSDGRERSARLLPRALPVEYPD